MDAPLALYRRYRPKTFDEVIGQSHVTGPLQYALANNRVHHAYLFSGPRGCGKTTSARILARALNGLDPSDRSEQIDIIEIDAASHGGVDDARDLRERAFFAPVNSPYKIYIVDEAHMVSSQGFNALLKLVEEPPPHLKFIFATTEPDKVIGTIRSRTHHYPFRLVPPKLLSDYLSTLCEKEGVTIEPTALPLIVRAGGGSVRDTLSVLDQLLGGAGPGGVTYDLAVALLGYTPDSLLDEVIDALAAGDGASVFAAVDKVIETGQDPRRFAEDLLQRLRDLIIVAAVPDAIEKSLLDVPEDMAARLNGQSARFGPTELTRSADIVSKGLTELRGATAPRLLLELMCASVLLPAADHTSEGFGARLDRLERRMSIAADAPAAVAAPTVPAPTQPSPPVEQPTASPVAATPPSEPASPVADEPVAAPVEARPAPSDPPAEPVPAPPAEPPPPASQDPGSDRPADPGAMSLTDVRRLWPEVLDKVMRIRRFTWVMLSQNAQVHALEGNLLTISLVNAGARDSFVRSGSEKILQQALLDVLGADWRIETVVDPSAKDVGTPPPASEPTAAATAPAPETPSPDTTTETAKNESAAAREAIRPTRHGTEDDTDRNAETDSVVDRNDPTVGTDGLDAEALLAAELGAHVIEETPHD